MDIKSVMQRMIVRLWNRQYRLAHEARDTWWTRTQQRALTRIAKAINRRMKERM